MCIKQINSFFKTATRADVNDLLGKIVLTDRQTRVFEMFYLRDMNIGFISDSLNCSSSVVNEELKLIRDKMEKAMTVTS